jgi:hypothetical protein
MASAVRNHVADGLSGIFNIFLWAASRQILLTTSAVIVKLSAQVVVLIN